MGAVLNGIVSVITPVIPAGSRYLPEAYRSLAAQELPAGWSWEWLVQQDGLDGAVANLLPDDPRISFGRSRHGGPGVARTVALQRANGGLVKTLDADDELTPGALARDIAVLARYPDLGWTASKALDLFPDGSTRGWDEDEPAEGPLTGEEMFEAWVSNDCRPPVVPGTVCIRRELLLALGGWMALPASEDTGMLLAAGAVSPGYFIAETGLLYRKWPAQATAQPAHLDPVERNARMGLIRARVLALRDTHKGKM